MYDFHYLPWLIDNKGRCWRVGFKWPSTLYLLQSQPFTRTCCTKRTIYFDCNWNWTNRCWIIEYCHHFALWCPISASSSSGMLAISILLWALVPTQCHNVMQVLKHLYKLCWKLTCWHSWLGLMETTMRTRSGGNRLLGDRTSNQYSVPSINYIGTVFEMDVCFVSLSAC